MKADPQEFIPIAFFGFQMEGDKQVIYQLWSTAFGQQEWRPVPMIKMSERKPVVAGFVPADDGSNDDD